MGEQQLSILRAVNKTLAELMRRDERVFLIGEDIGRHGGSFQATAGLVEEFGAERVVDAPVSEAGIVGLAVGAALTGMRPMVDLMFCDFATLAMDQIVNQAAHLRYMTGGQVEVPLVVRAACGAGQSSAAQHSQSLHAWFAHIPGLRVVLPATPADARGLLVAAFEDPNPVLVLEDKMEYGRRGPVPDALEAVPLGVASVRRRGDDVTVVATSSMVYEALAGAEILANDGISVEVIDPRTIAPLDRETLVASVCRTGRAVVMDEGHRSFGAGAEIAATIAEGAFDYLEEPVLRLGAKDVPVPFNPELERVTIPDAQALVDAVRGMAR
jgi:acetoin:2,6-dichlorophenolindophenol oxidoreductase subunit beta